mmetsp:Transcript_23285/g.37303  ORF Transcript_23285/g.37303 Transcript_23285/m.37303 type:complete len:212 (+) Transcript_23285:944-1579(+)
MNATANETAIVSAIVVMQQTTSVNATNDANVNGMCCFLMTKRRMTTTMNVNENVVYCVDHDAIYATIFSCCCCDAYDHDHVSGENGCENDCCAYVSCRRVYFDSLNENAIFYDRDLSSCAILSSYSLALCLDRDDHAMISLCFSLSISCVSHHQQHQIRMANANENECESEILKAISSCLNFDVCDHANVISIYCETRIALYVSIWCLFLP